MKVNIKKLGWDAMELSNQFQDETITSSFYREAIRNLVEQYATQTVIEELENVSHNSDYATDIALHHRLQELKED